MCHHPLGMHATCSWTACGTLQQHYVITPRVPLDLQHSRSSLQAEGKADLQPEEADLQPPVNSSGTGMGRMSMP